MSSVRNRALLAITAGLLLGAALGYGTSVHAQEQAEPTEIKFSEVFEIQPGGLTGKVYMPDGKTPVGRAALHVWRVDKKEFVHVGEADKDGAYKLENMEAGRYLVIFGDRVMVKVQVKEEQNTGREAEVAESVPARPESRLDVLLPRGRGIFAQMPLNEKSVRLEAATQDDDEDEDRKTIFGLPMRTVIIGGVVLTGAVVTSVVIAESGGDGDDGGGDVPCHPTGGLL